MTTVINDDLLAKVAKVIGGDLAVEIVMMLNNTKEATGDQIMIETEIGLNDIRKVLFKLYKHSIIQCTRERDPNTGWFIFRWKLQSDQVEGFILNQKHRILKILGAQLNHEDNHEFYCCSTPSCSRLTFEDAVEIVFQCPVCHKLLQHVDNSSIKKLLNDKINEIEKELS